jgi:hypothetical protein
MIKNLYNSKITFQECPACCSAEIEPFKNIKSFPAILFPIEKEKWNTVKTSSINSDICNDCGHIFLNQIDKSFSDAIYKDYYYLYPFKGLESMQLSYRKSFEEVASLYFSSKVKASLLEIGCDSQDQMKLFLDLGYYCTAINPGAKPNKSIDFINGFYGTNKITGKFDFIISRFNLEHIVDCDKFFSEIHQNISDDGTVIVQVPNVEYFLSSGILNVLAHEHPQYFCHKSLKKMVQRHNFEILYISKPCEPSIVCAFIPSTKKHYKPKQDIALAGNVLNQLKELVKNAPDNVILYGAGLSLTALLYANERDENFMCKIQIVDDNPLIQGRCMPNTLLEVFPPSQMELRPKSIIVLTLSQQYQPKILARLFRNNDITSVYVVNSEGLNVKANQ